MDPKYYSPFYRDNLKGTPNLGVNPSQFVFSTRNKSCEHVEAGHIVTRTPAINSHDNHSNDLQPFATVVKRELHK